MLNQIDPAQDAVALWAENQFAALGVTTNPEYGSLAWQTLRAAAPERAAAIIEAAELWRRHRAHATRLEQLLDNDPEAWAREVTADANAYARRIAPALAKQRTQAEIEARRATMPEAWPLTATPGWPPIALPGRPGWWRHLINGRQADLPHHDPPGQERAA
ncbi:hypothetical protein ACFZB6_31090 [Streptomyces syringium]|uniref:hypothetical protein n=1 Tax=Streptomyces syringium TaxID=76729 RepID=UPI0036E252F1